jgi:hypothetical protein
MIQQAAAVACVLGRDPIDLAQHALRTRGKILEIADGCSNNKKCARLR